MSDLDARLRAIGELLPAPDERATDDARAAMHRARVAAAWATGRRRSWFSSRGPRTYLIAAALALLIGGGALAAAWSLGGLPGFGRDPEQAFVAPRTDILPGGYERSRPPRITELPTRPSLRFPAGMTYTQAVAAYYRARRAGEVVPRGVELAAPLPEGKVVLVEGGRVSLDPAAPVGFNPTTGLVGVLSGAPAGPIPLPRCEVLLGRDDPDSTPCRATTHPTFISEGVAGRWLPSQVGGIPARVVGSDRLSILNRPLQAGDGLPADALGSPLGPFSPSREDLAHARLAGVVDGARLYVVPVGSTGVCLAVRGRAADVGSGCNPLSVLTSYGAIFLTSSLGHGRYRYAAIIGDGFDHASGSGGEQVAITNNVFAMALRPGTDLIAISGPAGRYRLRVIGNRLPPTTRGDGTPQGADLARRRVVVRIALSDGRTETIWRAPRRGGGVCFWSGRFVGCRNGSRRIPVDMVTAGFSAGGPGVPVVLSGQLASRVGALLLRYSDGSSLRLTPHEGWVLYEVPADHLTASRMPAALTTLDHKGVALARLPLDFAPIVRQRRPRP